MMSRLVIRYSLIEPLSAPGGWQIEAIIMHVYFLGSLLRRSRSHNTSCVSSSKSAKRSYTKASAT